MGIPCNGEEIVVHTRRGTSNRTYTISLLEQNLENLAIGDDFRKTFLIFYSHLIPSLKEYMTYGTPYGMVTLVSKRIGQNLSYIT